MSVWLSHAVLIPIYWNRAWIVRLSLPISPCVNASAPPFGGSGFKQSGIGRELGYHGLDDFLEVKQIFTDGTGLAAKPAYGQLIREG